MSNDINLVNNNEKNNKFLKYKKINTKANISLIYNRLNSIKNKNYNSNYNTNRHIIRKNFSLDKNIDFKSECISLNNISSSNKLSQGKKIFKKISSTNLEKYSNAILFKNRISKHLQFSRNKSNLNKNKLKLRYNNLNSIENEILNNKKYILKNHFLTPLRVRNISKNNESNRNNSFNINDIISPKSKEEKDNSEIPLPKVNSAFLEQKINSSNLEDKEKEKILISQNLNNLLEKIKKKIIPKKRVILSPNKLPYILNKNKKLIENQKSCIHKLELGNSLVFVKTHLDGLDKEKTINEIKNSSSNIWKKYDINEGYVDLNVLNSGNNISFKTNLIHKDGLYFYEFNKYGRMETVEERVHRVKKDKKGFQKLLEKYHENEVFKHMENQDFEIIKKKYEEKPIINKNIYRDLFHMLYKK